MKSLRLIFFALLSLNAFGLFAAPFDMIPAGDPILEDLRYLSLESGNSFLSFTPPLSPGEVELFINSLDLSLLSKPAEEAYYRIKKRLNPEASLSFSSNYFSVLINLNSTFEARARFNTDISWEPFYPNIPPLVSVPLRFCFFDLAQLYVEPVLAVNPNQYKNAETIGVNVPYAGDHLDMNMPLRAFLAGGGSWWNFHLGRDRLFWGTGQTGSLSFAGNSAFFEFMRISFFADFFKYSMIVNQLPLEITKELYPKPFEDDADPVNLMETTLRHFYMHRIDITLFNRVSVGVMEGIMAGNSALELRFLNPLAIFHSFYPWLDYDTWPDSSSSGSMLGSFFSVELNWNIIKNLAFYGQFIMNEFATKGELKNETGFQEPPNGLGYLAGLNYTHSFNSWGSFFFIEFIYTDPYCYMLSSPFASFIQMRRLSPTNEEYYFIGYPRDTIAFTLGARFFQRDKLSFQGCLSLFIKGEHDKDGLKWDWERTMDAFDEKTPSGIAENKIVASLSAKWKIFPFLAANGNITGIFSRDNRHISGSNAAGLQTAASITFSY